MSSWIQRRKKSQQQNVKGHRDTSKNLNFKGSKENYIRNGARVLEESISLFHGRTNPIRHFSVHELNCMNVKQKVYFRGDTYNLYQGSWEGRIVLVYKTCGDSFTLELECVREIVVATKMATHNNTHKLIGCCLETKPPVLVYEWVKAGSLQDYIILQDGDENQPLLLEWKDRLRIAWEISHVVSYLHTAFPRPIIHRNLKPSNVFLDENNSAKLHDFSLSISLPEGEEFVDNPVCGTIGYLDPEYMETGNVAESSDVYSFGVLLLVLLTGKRANFSNQQGDGFLVNWVQDVIKGIEVWEIIDSCITTNGVTTTEELQLRASIQLALFCTAYEGDSRPTMVEVATALKTMIDSPESIPTITSFHVYFQNKEVGSPLEALTSKAHTSKNSTNSPSFEDQAVDQVQCKGNEAKRTNMDDLKDKRTMQPKELLRSQCSEPLKLLVAPELLKCLPNSCKELHDLMALQPLGTCISVRFSAYIFRYHDTQEEVNVYVTTQDVVQLLSMQSLSTSCIQIFMRNLHNKCKRLASASIGFMCPKRLAMAKMHLIYTSQYLHYAITELQTKSYILAPYFRGTHWTLIVVCPQRHVVLFFDPMGKNLDGRLGIKGRINMQVVGL